MKRATAPLRSGSVTPNFLAETQVPIDCHESIGNERVFLSSHPEDHPEDYTPICTTELGFFAKFESEFNKRGVKLIGLSANTIKSKGFIGKDWDILSYSKDYTSVSTIDLGAFEKLEPDFGNLDLEFAKLNLKFRNLDPELTERGIKLIGLSINTFESNRSWIKDIVDKISDSTLSFPIIGDKQHEIEPTTVSKVDIFKDIPLDHSHFLEATNKVNTRQPQLAKLPSEAHIAFHRGLEVCAF